MFGEFQLMQLFCQQRPQRLLQRGRQRARRTPLLPRRQSLKAMVRINALTHQLVNNHTFIVMINKGLNTDVWCHLCIILNVFGQMNTIDFYTTHEIKNMCPHFPGFCLFVGNLNSNKDFEEIKTSLRKFFSKNDLEVADVRLGGSK